MTKTSYKRVFFAFFCLSPFFLLTAFRDYDVGVDTITYFLEYQVASTESYTIRGTEPLFSYLLIVFNSLDISFRGFLFFQSLIYYLSISLLASFVPQRTVITYILVMVSFGILSFGFSGIRQSIAMSLFFVAVYLWAYRSYSWYLALAFFAFFIHNTSLVAFFIFIFVLVASKFSVRYLLLFVFLLSPVFSILDLSGLNLFSDLSIKQNHYLQADEDLLNFKVPSSFYFVLFISFFILAFKVKNRSLSVRESANTAERVERMVAWGAVIAACFFWMAMSVRLTDRLAFYFVPFAGILVSWAINSPSRSYVKIAMKVLLLLILGAVFVIVNEILLFSILG